MRCRYCFERCCVLLLFKDTATTEIYTTDTLFPYTTLFRSPKARRGDVRAAILSVLAEEAMNGYQVIQQIAERSEGAWKPSPGSVYPTIQQLEDERLVEGRDTQGRRLLHLTNAGQAYVASHADEIAATCQAFPETDQEPPSAGATGPLLPVAHPGM